jgi:hypothetical protein
VGQLDLAAAVVQSHERESNDADYWRSSPYEQRATRADIGRIRGIDSGRASNKM